MSERAKLPPRPFEASDHLWMVKTIKALAMDAVEAAQSGHPGMPMGAADMAVSLWMQFLVFDPDEPRWPNRDRFVLSAGHGSMLLYSLLHLTGFDLPLAELQAFRQLGSKTPGHPEFGHTSGVEVTTGPLGTGFAAGVGMALAERYLASRYNRNGLAVIDHFTYGIVSDGDLMEGVAAEAASFAGHQKLGKLIYLYDSNRITIDGATDLAFSEDVAARFVAYRWHVEHCDGHDRDALVSALQRARGILDKPSLLVCDTTIAHGSPGKAGTAASHGAPLGQREVDATKQAMGWPLEPKFYVPPELVERVRTAVAHGSEARRHWQTQWERYTAAHPELSAELSTLFAGENPSHLWDHLPVFKPGESIATRKAGAKVLAALAKVHPTLIGGSADLTDSNGVGISEAGVLAADAPAGRNIHFGVREHAMAGISNGMALHGGVRPFDATFLIFSDFMRGCLRLSALMRLPVIHVFSHDSLFLGEDGPTHQPIEQCMSLRLIPHLHVVRPADANETVGAWRYALSRKLGDGPTAILVTRQGVPVLDATRSDISVGAYVVWEPGERPPEGILVATGSEVSLAVEAAKLLEARGRPVRVVSMPCWEAFEAQPSHYRERVLPPAIRRRLSIEAGTTLGWDRYASFHHGIDRFGESAPAERLAEAFGFTAEAVASHYCELP